MSNRFAAALGKKGAPEGDADERAPDAPEAGQARPGAISLRKCPGSSANWP